MFMLVTIFTVVCCSKCRVFTHSTVWWNQLNRLDNTFIHKKVSISILKTNEISLAFLWTFFEATFHKPCCLWESGWGRTLSPCLSYSPPFSIRKATCPGDEAVCSLKQYLQYFAKYRVYFSVFILFYKFEHKI